MKSNFSGRKRSKGPVNFDGCFTRKPMFQEIASSEDTTFLSLTENYQNVCPEFSNNELHIPWVTTPPFSIFPSAHPSLSLSLALFLDVSIFFSFSLPFSHCYSLFLQLLLFLVENYIVLFEHRHHRKLTEILSPVLADFLFGQLARLKLTSEHSRTYIEPALDRFCVSRVCEWAHFLF